MASIEKIASPAPILDSNTAIFDAIEYLISKDCIHAFVQHEGKTIGIVAVEQLLENYKSRDMSDVTIREYMGPILKIKAGEDPLKREKSQRPEKIKDVKSAKASMKKS